MMLNQKSWLFAYVAILIINDISKRCRNFQPKDGIYAPKYGRAKVDFWSEALATPGLQAIYVTFGGNTLAPPKVTETTRQLASAVTAAIAVGIGLLVTRLTTATPPALIIGVMSVVTIYIVVVIFSGVQFIRIQNTLRKEWQPRLYRFIPQDEYAKLVIIPASRSEKTFYISSIMSSFAIAGLAILVIFQTLTDSHTALNTNPNNITLYSSSSRSQSSKQLITLDSKSSELKSDKSASAQNNSSAPSKTEP